MTSDKDYRFLGEALEQATITAFSKTEPVKRDHDLKVRRFLAAGNAGGLIAALSLSGTMIANSGSSEGPPLHWTLFCVTLVFAVGLLGVGLNLFSDKAYHMALEADYLRAALHKQFTEEGFEWSVMEERLPINSKHISRLSFLHVIALYLAGISLFIGSIGGLCVLAGFTAIPEIISKLIDLT